MSTYANPSPTITSSSNAINDCIDSTLSFPDISDDFLNSTFSSFPDDWTKNINDHPMVEDDNEPEVPIKRVATSNEYRRVPCKARGLSNTHTSDYAYIEIPIDAPHGMLLCCSHYDCQVSGRRFRYCQVCQVPVAKRNFLRRHGHGLIETSKELKDTVDNTQNFALLRTVGRPEMTCIPVREGSPEIDCSRPELAVEEHPSSPPAAKKPRHRRVVSHADPSQFVAGRPHHRRVVSYDVNSMASEVYRKEASPSSPKKHPLSGDEEQWLSLFHKRPDLDNHSKMTKWIDNVLDFVNVSNTTKTPMSTDEQEGTGPAQVTPQSMGEQDFNFRSESPSPSPARHVSWNADDDDVVMRKEANTLTMNDVSQDIMTSTIDEVLPASAAETSGYKADLQTAMEDADLLNAIFA